MRQVDVRNSLRIVIYVFMALSLFLGSAHTAWGRISREPDNLHVRLGSGWGDGSRNEGIVRGDQQGARETHGGRQQGWRRFGGDAESAEEPEP